MAPPRTEKSQLKRQRVSRLLFCPTFWCAILNRLPLAKGSLPESDLDAKKPRRSERLSVDKTPVSHKQHLPSPVTRDSDEIYKEPTATPPEGRPSQVNHRDKDDSSQSQALNNLSSPPQDTQAFSQYPADNKDVLSDEVEDEVKEGVWGYLFPLDTKYGKCLVMKKRAACPMPDKLEGKDAGPANLKGKSPLKKEEEAYERTKVKGVASGGYLIGRHPECDIVVEDPVVSNRHCLIFTENKGGDTVAILEDLSSNGTFVNEANVGRNKRRELQEQDEIAVLDKARFIFRYPKSRQTSAFLQQYTLLEKLGKGHFAEVFLCVEKSTGQRYAVKIFTKTAGMEERSKQEGLQQEIAVLMGVSHPNVLCLKDTFNERNAVYLVLELAPEGELFNFIVMKQKLTEDETRKLFVQLFQGIKYLVSIADVGRLYSALTRHSTIETLFIGISNQKTF
ncbi:serine threonine-protein kinase chk2 [Colletotrichum truncatum]|uniref:Serine threonine-protein kinase chk2 n=1 Tax=Colletotrichum truncatum TaxID=5467 RepID=A0ACC3Z4M1_COLTU